MDARGAKGAKGARVRLHGGGFVQFAQPELLDLPGRGHREALHEAPVTRDLEPRELSFTEFVQVSWAGRGPRLRPDRRGDLLAEELAADPVDGGIEDGRVQPQHILDFLRR